jgi:Family of unknown function (DUF5677)
VTDLEKTQMDPETTKALGYAQKLLDAAIAVVGASHAVVDAIHSEGNTVWARDPKVIALALLCRCISNFNAAMILVNERHVMEARVLVRLMYESELWVAVLRERGAAFVQDMIADEGANRKALAELTMKMTGKHGGDVDSPDSLKLRSIINELPQHFPKMEKLHANRIAAAGVIETAYVEYQRLSLDAVHCSVTALGRHVFSERTENMVERIISVEAKTSPKEILSTILHACRALMGTAVGANELLAFTTESGKLSALVTEFETNGWVH